MMNNLICWEENHVKHWDMIKDSDRNTFLMNLMQNSKVNNHTIFIIPCSEFVAGIWLWYRTHENSRVNFYNFYKEYGEPYEPPVTKEENKAVLAETHERQSLDTKYGWISPEGKYFHCCYQGHVDLADKICFGMVDTANSEQYLEEHGWCKIYKSLFDTKYSVYVGGNHVITDAQMKELIKLDLENAHGLSEMLCKDKVSGGNKH